MCVSFVRRAGNVLEEVKCHRVLTGLPLPLLLLLGRWKPVSAVNLPISCQVIKDAVDEPQDPADAAGPQPPQAPPHPFSLPPESTLTPMCCHCCLFIYFFNARHQRGETARIHANLIRDPWWMKPRAEHLSDPPSLDGLVKCD